MPQPQRSVPGASWGTESPESSAPLPEAAGVRQSHEPILRGLPPPPAHGAQHVASPTAEEGVTSAPVKPAAPPQSLSGTRRKGRAGRTDGRSGSVFGMGALVLLLCLAVCIFTPPGDGAQELTTPGSGIEARCDGCPRHKSSATLVPSFTKTTPTTPHRTTRPTNHTTTHPANHTTPHPANHTTTHGTHHTTTHPANHTTPHPANHTTTHPTNHTTPHPANHTTTHPTNHTTTHPTNHTTPHPANHTTTHPTNHTTQHTTPHLTTAAPTLPPDAAVGNYSVWNGSDICLRVQSGLQIRIQYENRSKVRLWGAFAVQPNHTMVAGTCSQDSATMNITFAQGFLHFTFVKNTTQNAVYLHEVRASLSVHFPGATQSRFAAQNSSLREFEARLGHSYQCGNRSLALAPAFRLDALHERLQAFALPGGHFGDGTAPLGPPSPSAAPATSHLPLPPISPIRH
ncbi:macrosialin [Chelonia mydas]|uniref:macrosialin n=1 Tax=Chelonia mydas TaxID=8469 RepID=UPI001CA7EBD1|nr:macrosialin [Chelonia mydas]